MAKWASIPARLWGRQDALQRWNGDYDVTLSPSKVKRALRGVQPSWVHDFGVCWFGCLTAVPWGEWLKEYNLGEEEFCRYLQTYHVAYDQEGDLLVIRGNPKATFNDELQRLVDEDETVHGENITESLRWVLISIRDELDKVEDLWDFTPLSYCPGCGSWVVSDERGQCPDCGELCLSDWIPE